MRRLIASLSTAAIAFSTVAPAFALFEKSSDLLIHLLTQGGPRLFTMEMHANIDENIYMSLWAKGAFEGRRPSTAKSKMDITVDIKSDDDYARIRLKTILNQQTFYGMIESIDISGQEDFSDITDSIQMNQWFTMPMDNDMYDELSDETIRQMLLESGIAEVIDNIFVMKKVRFDTGYSYSLKPHPLLVTDHVPVYDDRPTADMTLSDWLESQNNDWDEPFYGRPPNGSLAHTNIHIKVDTNFVDELLFMKYYFSHNSDGIQFVIQGTVNHSPTPIYLTIPTDTVSLDEYIGNVDVPDAYLMKLMMDDWGTDSREEDEWGTEDEWDTGWDAEDEWEDTYYDVIPEPEIETIGREAHFRDNVGRLPNDCDRYRNSAEQYIYLARKGICPMEFDLSRRRHRYNTNSDIRAGIRQRVPDTRY